MLSLYPAYFIKDDDGYTVTFPDWDGACTCGKTFDEAMAMAVDCLAGLLFSCKLDNDPIPKASQLSAFDAKKIAAQENCKPNQVIINMVSVDADVYTKTHFEKCVKKTVTILEWQNTEGIKLGVNFSKIFQDALTAELRRLRKLQLKAQ